MLKPLFKKTKIGRKSGGKPLDGIFLEDMQSQTFGPILTTA